MTHRIVRADGRRLKLLAIPAPYRAWLSISNDPDHTTHDSWRELDQVIWQDLKLPLADSFFVVNYNEQIPGQVNLRDHPEILKAHDHDTMHTWGDFLGTSKIKFDRQHAVEALELIRKLSIEPRVWTDHSGFEGNLLHRATRKAVPTSVDAAGHCYDNLTYSLDLIRNAGVRYVWDGGRTGVIGQDRKLSRIQHYAATTNRRSSAIAKAAADRLGRPIWKTVKAQLFDYRQGENGQYDLQEFPDGQRFYRFQRFGRWKDADIDGLAKTLSQHFIEQLLHVNGTAVIYTHLGKRKADRLSESTHIPPDTLDAFKRLAKLHASGDLKLSGTGKLLDYLVLRDHAVLAGGIDFRPDGVRFQDLTAEDLRGHAFAVQCPQGSFHVRCNGQEISHEVSDLGRGVFQITFPDDRSSTNP